MEKYPIKIVRDRLAGGWRVARVNPRTGDFTPLTESLYWAEAEKQLDVIRAALK